MSIFDVRTKFCKAMASLKAFNISDQRYVKPWCL